MRQSIWNILGIEPTNDKKKIKQAYAAKAKNCHPEDHPEAFQELQHAYKMALSQTSNTISTQSNHPITKDRDSIGETSQQFHFDQEVIYIKNNQELFNDDYQIDETVDIREYQDYLYQNFARSLGKTLNEKKLEAMYQNTNLMSQLENSEFKERIENLLVSKNIRIKKKNYIKCIRELENNHIDKLALKLKKKGGLNKSFQTIGFIVIAILAITGFLTEEKETKPVTEPQIMEIGTLGDDLARSEYHINAKYLYDMSVERVNGLYVLNNKDGKTLIDSITDVKYTYSEILLLLKDEKFLIYNTSNQTRTQLNYKYVKTANIIRDGVDKLSKIIIASEDNVKWSQLDSYGIEVQSIEGSLPTSTIINVYQSTKQGQRLSFTQPDSQ